MKKGKYGVVLSFYPILAFACVILKLPFIWLAPFLAIFVEQDEWAGRQTLQALFLSWVVSLFSDLIPRMISLLPVSWFSGFLTVAANVVSVLIYLLAIILSILAITRVLKDQEANLPLLSDAAYRIYSLRKPQTVPFPQQPQQAPPVPGQAPVQAAQPAAPAQPQPVNPQQAQPLPVDLKPEDGNQPNP